MANIFRRQILLLGYDFRDRDVEIEMTQKIALEFKKREEESIGTPKATLIYDERGTDRSPLHNDNDYGDM